MKRDLHVPGWLYGTAHGLWAEVWGGILSVMVCVGPRLLLGSRVGVCCCHLCCFRIKQVLASGSWHSGMQKTAECC